MRKIILILLGAAVGAFVAHSLYHGLHSFVEMLHEYFQYIVVPPIGMI